MPRLRTFALAAFVSIASFGVGAALALRWLIRETLLLKAGHAPTLAAVLRPRGNEGRALLWGVAFLPVFWGGLLTFWSPVLAFGSRGPDGEPLPVLIAWLVAGALCLLMRLLYPRAWPIAGEMEPLADSDPEAGSLAAAGRDAFRRHLKVTLWCGLPGLIVCSIALATPHPDALWVLALFVVPPALVAPWIGGLSILPILARAGQAPTRMRSPATPHRLWRRLAVAAAACGLLGLWVWQAALVVGPPPLAPLLQRSDFDMGRLCYFPPLTDEPPMASREVVRSRLVAAGVACDGDYADVGEIDLGGQYLDWCQPPPNHPVPFVAIGALGKVLARRDLQLVSPAVIRTSRGFILLARDEQGLRVLRLGRDAREEAVWRPTGGASFAVLAPRRSGGVMVGWDPPGRAALVHLSGDLVPVRPPVMVDSARAPHALDWGRGSCLSLSDVPALLVLDEHDAIHRPPLGERIAARGGSALHVGWTALVLAFVVVASLRAGRLRRRFGRFARLGRVSEGTLWTTGEGSANLRRADGELVRIRTEGATWYGLADDEPRDGPCTVVGIGSHSGGAAYRTAPVEVDAGACVGIVRGDLAQARGWVLGHRDRVVALAVLLGWLVTGPTLLLLALSG